MKRLIIFSEDDFSVLGECKTSRLSRSNRRQAREGKKNPSGFNSRGGNEVELEGIEPSSKQGIPELSTRLFQTVFSSLRPTWTTAAGLIL